MQHYSAYILVLARRHKVLENHALLHLRRQRVQLVLSDEERQYVALEGAIAVASVEHHSCRGTTRGSSRRLGSLLTRSVGLAASDNGGDICVPCPLRLNRSGGGAAGGCCV